METASHIKQWFELAVPAPTDKNRAVQLGVHFEEVGEMMPPLNMPADVQARLKEVADRLKKSMLVPADALNDDEKVELLDSLCDQVVTAIGVAHMFGMNIAGALAEVNASNWSKFVDGKPIFNEHGKIAKGPNYRKPVLRPFIGELQAVSDAQVKA